MTLKRATSIAALVTAAGCLGGCDTLAPSAFANGTPEFRPEAFFAGTTSSSGVLQNRAGEPTRRLHVEGQGQVLADGSLRLEQSVSFDGNAAEQRTWLMQRLDAHHFSATLTDAVGPVQAEAYGDLFHVRYAMKSPPGGQMEQWLYLQPDGRTVLNEATVRVLGIVVARLSERITNEGP